MTARPDNRRHGLLIAGAVASVMVAVGLVLSTVGRPSPAADRSQPIDGHRDHRVAHGAGPGPSTEEAGMPVGFGRDRQGAAAAGVAYATASQRWLYFTDDQLRAAVAEIATRASVDRLAADVVADVGSARKQLGASPGRVWWLVRPLAWHVEYLRPTEARVGVWAVSVLSAEEVAAPQSEWLTVTVDLRWERGDWRVDDVQDDPGPTPMTGPKDRPWDAEPFDTALAGFTRLDGELAP